MNRKKVRTGKIEILKRGDYGDVYGKSINFLVIFHKLTGLIIKNKMICLIINYYIKTNKGFFLDYIMTLIFT